MTLAKPINTVLIHEYTLQRSIASPRLVNVVALDKKGKVLAVIKADIDFDTGAEMVGIMNDLNERCSSLWDKTTTDCVGANPIIA